jgi:hypothetical protein
MYQIGREELSDWKTIQSLWNHIFDVIWKSLAWITGTLIYRSSGGTDTRRPTLHRKHNNHGSLCWKLTQCAVSSAALCRGLPASSVFVAALVTHGVATVEILESVNQIQLLIQRVWNRLANSDDQVKKRMDLAWREKPAGGLESVPWYWQCKLTKLLIY